MHKHVDFLHKDVIEDCRKLQLLRISRGDKFSDAVPSFIYVETVEHIFYAFRAIAETNEEEKSAMVALAAELTSSPRKR